MMRLSLAWCPFVAAFLFLSGGPVFAQLGTAPIRPAERPKVSLKEVGARFSNKTVVVWDARHGTQVEYTSADGKAFLWYPTNAVVLAGAWKIDERELRLQFEGESDIRTIRQPQVCFRYGANTYNPVTGHRGDGWQCTPSAALQRGDTRSGDPFGLARRKEAPFVLPRSERLTFPQIAARLRAGGR